MSDIAIKVENLSKLYQLGTVGTGTLKNDIRRWWANARGKEDPFSKIGQINDRTKKATSEFVWALKDIEFEVKKGEVLGIIGRNGAGKSTLLKILSKITSPTTGKIKIDGRIASLLEVGTGFHPELSGRDNIFMNGAILGMRKWEIQKKFDEIVDFSGVEAYIDTPVKRYSSGMYVRLAFAVAAFLEPEILIVDEVLAVGDAEFQKKCLGRMKDVSVNEGRTVLFVSHNMASIKSLCSRGILMNNGTINCESTISEVISLYLSDNLNVKNKESEYRNIPKGYCDLYISEAFMCDISNNKKAVFEINENVYFKLKIVVNQAVQGVYGYITVSNISEILLIESDTKEFGDNILSELRVGENDFMICIPKFILPHGTHFIYLNFTSSYSDQFNVYSPGYILSFSVEDNTTSRSFRRNALTSQILNWERID